MKQDILSRLLDKYENSKHLFEPGVSARRVMLRIEKKELPEYNYQEASVRDAYNEAALELEKEHLVTLEWLADRPVMSAIVLNLDHVDACYCLIGRKHLKEQVLIVAQMIEERVILCFNALDYLMAKRGLCKSEKRFQRSCLL